MGLKFYHVITLYIYICIYIYHWILPTFSISEQFCGTRHLNHVSIYILELHFTTIILTSTFDLLLENLQKLIVQVRLIYIQVKKVVKVVYLKLGKTLMVKWIWWYINNLVYLFLFERSIEISGNHIWRESLIYQGGRETTLNFWYFWYF